MDNVKNVINELQILHKYIYSTFGQFHTYHTYGNTYTYGHIPKKNIISDDHNNAYELEIINKQYVENISN